MVYSKIARAYYRKPKITLTGYKIVSLNYTEQASLVVKASTNEEAEAAIWAEFSHIPELRIISIEEADEEVVAQVKEVKSERGEEDFIGEKKVLN